MSYLVPIRETPPRRESAGIRCCWQRPREDGGATGSAHPRKWARVPPNAIEETITENEPGRGPEASYKPVHGAPGAVGAEGGTFPPAMTRLCSKGDAARNPAWVSLVLRATSRTLDTERRMRAKPQERQG